MIDSLTRHPTGTAFEADLCVVGGGPVGIALAREFLDGSTRVLLLESGGESPDEAIQCLNRGAVVGAPFSGLELGRVRAFGGTTWTWAGQCLPLDPEAFERRSWVPASGWPLRADELDAYSERAGHFFGISPPSFAEDVWSEFGVGRPVLDEDLVIAKYTTYAQPLNSGQAYERDFRRSRAVTTLLHSTVVRLDLSGSLDRVAEVQISSLDGTRARVRAGSFVLCCGGIENARLLLLTNEIAGRLGTVGRFLQDHPRGVCARLEPLNRRTLHDQFSMFRRRRRRHLPRLVLSPRHQRQEQVLASYANVAWTPPRSGRALRSLREKPRTARGTAQSLGELVGDLPGLAAAGFRRSKGLSSAPRSGEMWLVVDSEQAPNRDSRVSLGRDRDALGRPEVIVDWRLGEPERRTMRTMVDAVAMEFLRLEMAVVRPAEWLGGPEGWIAHVSDSAHHIGTTRIAATPADGVVDENCRVHGVANLFVAGTSVFPSSGAANPTLAAVALALRLADHLKNGSIRG